MSQQAGLANVEKDAAAAGTAIRAEVELMDRDTSSSHLASAEDPATVGQEQIYLVCTALLPLKVCSLLHSS